MLRRAIMVAAAACALTPLAWAQGTTTAKTLPKPAPSQDYCIAVMSAFPAANTEPRYQFFKLTQQLAVGATPKFRAALTHYADGKINAKMPIMDVIEAIANPVIRQAAPELTIAYMKHLIDFSSRCSVFVDGQITSLLAFKPKLALGDSVITEDALYLRQILSDSLLRLKAGKDTRFGSAVNTYATSLITMRDNIEFQAYASEIGEIEALYMTDLDGRLARSNDIINSEINRETLGDAVILSDDMNRQAKKQDQQRSISTLLRILSRY